LVPDAVIPLHAVIIMAEHVTSERQATQIMTVVEADEIEAEAVPRLPDAYLILEGSRYVALDRSVVNLGRRRDNTIVVDDVRVSRQHCQLRFRFGHFVLYDLGSRGGTFVNHRRVTECVLRNGDVISLAGVTLVYMIEEPPADEAPRGAGDTQVRSQPVDEGE
jgi:pSer/pThr/pTyr-binding forkhead associated (FHA) protein